MAKSDLANRSFKGAVWSLIDGFSGSLISFGIGILLARLLSPADFGLVGMVVIVFTIANSLVDSGLSVGLIRKSNCSDKDYNTVFLFNILFSLLVYTLIFFSAPHISSFFGVPDLISIIRVLGLTVIFDSLGIIHRVIIIRNVDFKKQAKISVAATLISGLIGVLFAYYGYGVWSLVTQMVIKQMCISLFFWLTTKWTPSFEFSLSSFKELYSFGYKMLLAGLIVNIQNNIYYVLIGKFFNSFSLGFYSRAEQFNAFVISNMTNAFDKVFFPSLASIQEDVNRLKSSSKRVLCSTFMIITLVAGFLFASAEPIILILLGEKWRASVYYLQLMTLATIFLPFNTLNINTLKIKGKSNKILKLQMIKVLLLIPNLFVGYNFGISPMLITAFFSSLISVIINSYYANRELNYSLFEQVKDVMPYFVIILTATLICWFITFLDFSYFLVLPFQFITGLLITISGFELLKLNEYQELKSNLKKFQFR